MGVDTYQEHPRTVGAKLLSNLIYQTSRILNSEMVIFMKIGAPRNGLQSKDKKTGNRKKV